MSGNPTSDDPEQQWRREAVRQRLEYLEAMSAALDRRVEVMELIASSSSADEAADRVRGLLGISEIGAMAVLDLQWRRFAQMERACIVDERDRLRRELA